MSAPQDPKPIARLTAFAETVILLVAGSLAAAAIASALGLAGRDGRDALLFGAGGPRWIEAGGAETQWLLLRFGLTLALAWLICWWIGGPSRQLAGLSRGGRSLRDLIGFGVVMGVLLAAAPFGLRVLNEMFALGENTPFWNLMARHEWTPAFWLYMAASSFVIVPIVEELFFRSYMLGRYRMHFTAGGAVLLSAALFWVSHGQYIKADPLLITNSVLVFISAAILAWSAIRTGSVLPAIIAHAIFNIPMTSPFRVAVVVLAVLLVVMLWARIRAAASDFFRTLATTREWIFLAVLIGLLTALAFIVRAYGQALIPLAGAIALLALWGLIRRVPWARRG